MRRIVLKRSRRAKRMRLSVAPGGALEVTAPHALPQEHIDAFLEQHKEWIDRATERMGRFKRLPVAGRRDYLRHRERARAFIEEKVRIWNQTFGFVYHRISIRRTRRTWGSCSRVGNLNFSYAILFLPNELSDYVVVHELAHLTEANHGPRFWAVVARALPNYHVLRQRLRAYVLE